MTLERRKRVLIVDDERDLREAIAFDFKRKGHEVLEASGGHDAFQIIEKNEIDLVITDVHMPAGSGIELLDRIKASKRSLSVFIFIGSASPEDEVSPEVAYEKGAEAVFSKPFDRKELFEAAARFMRPTMERFERRAPRLEVEAQAGVSFLESGFSIQTSTVNIGRGGMFVALSERMPKVREQLEFHVVTQADSVSLKGTGIVRWLREGPEEEFSKGCGIEFVTLDDASVEHLVALSKDHRYKSFIPRK
jgi:CheY-like chemotaxis protein